MLLVRPLRLLRLLHLHLMLFLLLLDGLFALRLVRTVLLLEFEWGLLLFEELGGKLRIVGGPVGLRVGLVDGV